MDLFQLAIHGWEMANIRLEKVAGIPVWEAAAGWTHQKAKDRIRASFRAAPGTDCRHVADVHILFPDGSLKCPDIAIFPEEPTEQTTAVTMLPEAVIEILSPDYEAKDISVGVPFYLRMQIKDILILDPDTGQVRHFRPGQSEAQYASPVTLTLACDCQVTI